MLQSHYHFSDPNRYCDIDDMMYDNNSHASTAYVCILVTTK